MNDRIKKHIDKLWLSIKKKPYVWGFWAVVILIVIPVLIWLAYLIGRTGFGIPTDFLAGDMLGLYGIIVGAGATITAVIITIKHERTQQILGAKPFLQSKSELLCFSEDVDLTKGAVEYVLYPFNKQELVGLSSKFTSNYIYRKDYPEIINTCDYLVFLYELSNAGFGNAVKVDLRINELVSIPKFFLPNNYSKKFVFIINKEKANTVLNISIQYTDVFNKYSYSQNEKIHITQDDKGALSYAQKLEDMLSEQIITKQEEN